MAFSDVKKFVASWRKELVELTVLVGVVSAVLLVLWWFGQVTFVKQEVTFVKIITGLLVLVGLYWTSRRVLAAEKTVRVGQANVRVGQANVRVAEEGQITERFTRAIAQLGDDKMAIRLGGIYALERIAKDSEKDHGPIMEVLTADVRENARKQGIYAEEAAAQPTTDIQAILTVFSRRKTIDPNRLIVVGSAEDGVPGRWQTSGKNRGPDSLDLNHTHLVGAELISADLTAANLAGANLAGANLTGAILFWADLNEAKLSGAILVGAWLEGAELEGAELEGAKLHDADLSMATLTGAKNLTAEQIQSARSCFGAKLPDYLPDSVKDLTKQPPPA